MRIALIVGINHYDYGNPLFGCVNDAYNVEEILHRNSSGSKNFDCKILTAGDSSQSISRASLKDSIKELFTTKSEIALFYFAGHGHIEATGGYLLASDSRRGDEGVSLSEILTFANNSPATNKLIILDSCHSGIAGTLPANGDIATLAEGLTILTASTKEQYATEKDGSGIFTTLLIDALSGAASNLVGDITPGSVYAHIDQSLGAWEQRPIFKTNVRNFVSLRTVTPSIPLEELRKLIEFFPSPGVEFRLDPTFEPEMRGRLKGMALPIEENVRKFSILQKYNRLNLLVPVDAPHMWHAAMKNKSCKLTSLGEHYRKLVAKERI